MNLLNNFKLGRENEDNSFLLTNNNQTFLTINNTVMFNQTEWVFQFDEEEPTVFATQQEEPNLTITLNNTSNASIEFTNNNRRFKIFARERHQ